MIWFRLSLLLVFFSCVCRFSHQHTDANRPCFLVPFSAIFHTTYSISHFLYIHWFYLCCLFACSMFTVWCIYVLPCGRCTNMNIYYAKRRRTKRNNNNRKNQRKLNGFCNRNYSTALSITSMAKTHWNCYNIFNEQLMRIWYNGTNTNYNTENVIEIQMHR